MLQAEVLKQRLEVRGLTEEVDRVDRLLNSGRQINALIVDLVETTRLEAGLGLQREVLDLRARIHLSVARLAASAERGRVRISDGEGAGARPRRFAPPRPRPR